MKKVGVLVLLVSVTLTYFLISTKPVFATPGVWSSSGSTIYYNDGPVGLGTAAPDVNYKITTLGGTDANAKYGQFKIQHIEDRYWRIRTLPYNHPDFGSYGLEITQPAENYVGCSGCGGDLVLAPYGDVVMMGMNTSNGLKTKVGINVKNPQYDLSVNGTILAKEVIVSNAASYWPDYVFESDYSLMSLEELQNYIKDNKHLPNISDENQVEKNGVSLGEMQRLQMEKIEELTLYVLQLNQRIETLEKENLQLKMNLN